MSEIIITLKSEEVEEEKIPTQQPTPKGIIPVQYVQEEDARRNLKKSGIRFFDLAVIENVSIFRQFIPVWEELDIEVLEAGLLGLYRQIEADIFAVPVDEREAQFQQIKKGDIQGEIIAVSVDDDFSTPLNESPRFENSIIELTESQLETFAFATGDGFPYPFLFYMDAVNFSYLDSYHITNIPDSDAPTVVFEAQPKMDIYIAPAVIYPTSFASYSKDLLVSPFTSEYWNDSLNLFYTTLNRNDVKNFYDNLIQYEDYTGPNYIYYSFYKYSQFQKSIPNSRTRKQIGPDNFYYGGSMYNSEPCFTPDEFTQVIGDIQYFLWSGIATNNDISHHEIKKLFYIVKKNNEWFYFWR